MAYQVSAAAGAVAAMQAIDALKAKEESDKKLSKEGVPDGVESPPLPGTEKANISKSRKRSRTKSPKKKITRTYKK